MNEATNIDDCRLQIADWLIDNLVIANRSIGDCGLAITRLPNGRIVDLRLGAALGNGQSSIA
jgi:hypothetical protein